MISSRLGSRFLGWYWGEASVEAAEPAIGSGALVHVPLRVHERADASPDLVEFHRTASTAERSPRVTADRVPSAQK